MKLILSRKGFDSSFGGCASAILPDGRLISLPIPHRFRRPPPAADELTFGDVYPSLVGQLAQELTRDLANPILSNTPVHLDPDLHAGPRRTWRPLFGQSDQAQQHLRNQGVGRGDLFLFFGWFRRICLEDAAWRFAPGARDLHVLFGWLRVGRTIRVDSEDIPTWARAHPHARPGFGPDNTIYVAARTYKGPDAGAFGCYEDELVLTAPGSDRRSCWRLPAWFHPHGRRSCLSYHGDPGRWHRDGDYAYLSTVARGQEFVLDAGDYPEAVPWAEGLIARNAP